ncbi:DUF386 domain-containing protein [Paenibacillus lycopersici]|uniref:DUF386 domain-containing protein n=1 Tax=Paenibacillus lycopersici TaxID=2704462 RepID=A0A6C0FRA4_9BACL|nr:YhcH/YjgK/YiaL family protein [Paenibacillus lycopersici]QHT59666.1 DUF386 domain-containing protein [Paenibacillus lycopersici]
MIIGNIGQLDADRAFLHPALVRALEELRSGACADPAANGRHDILGGEMYVIVSEVCGSPSEEKPFERHERYIDIHYVLAGSETIGWLPLAEGGAPYADELDASDYALYLPQGSEAYELPLRAGQYAVMFPHDLHRPGNTGGAIARKAVVKLHVDLFAVR